MRGHTPPSVHFVCMCVRFYETPSVQLRNIHTYIYTQTAVSSSRHARDVCVGRTFPLSTRRPSKKGVRAATHVCEGQREEKKVKNGNIKRMPRFSFPTTSVSPVERVRVYMVKSCSTRARNGRIFFSPEESIGFKASCSMGCIRTICVAK